MNQNCGVNKQVHVVFAKSGKMFVSKYAFACCIVPDVDVNAFFAEGCGLAWILH